MHAEPAPGVSPEANPYELMGRALLPIASVFTPQAAGRALSGTLRLEAMTGLPPEMAGVRVEMAVQPPDRVLIRGPYLGQTVTVCRVGQKIWISPGSKLAGTLAPRSGDPTSDHLKTLKPGQNAGGTLASLTIPFSPQELALLPALFQVTDAGQANGMRLLDVRLMAELAQKLGVEAWSARLFIIPASDERGHDSAKLAGFEIARPGWHLAARVERLQCNVSLPESQWEPGPPEAAGQSGALATPDVVWLTNAQIRDWVDDIVRQTSPNGKQTP